MPLKTACAREHTLVPILGQYFACECPAVYVRVGRFFLDPQRKGLLDDVIRASRPQGGIAAMARALEEAEAAKKAAKKQTTTRTRR